MLGFKTSKVGTNAAGDFKLKPILIFTLKILGPLRIILNLSYLCSNNCMTKPR